MEAVKLHLQYAGRCALAGSSMSCLPSIPKPRMANLDHAARHVLSSKQAPASLAESKAAITAARTASLPASALAKAANYALALGRNSQASWNTRNSN